MVAGHRTSISLEAPFWDALRAAAKARGLSVNALIAEIDAARPLDGPDRGSLSSALRVFALREARRGGGSG
ncbi:MAG: ribbon-helix-helix domain-containing protein [Alphaproteobacteria bacterium]|nr:ribbon-helix-helix domain-containing protein [Alphaproteobacteria bacterium]